MNLKTTITSIAFGAALCASGAAFAGSVTQPGETVGIALGAPLPEGVYFVDTGSVGGYRGVDDSKATEAVNIPVIAWSTPWTFLGGRIEAYAAVPELALGPLAGRDYMAMYNPFATVGLAWNLGNGWGFSNFLGGYAPAADGGLLGSVFNHWTFNERAALSYTGDHWNLTAHVIYGITGDNLDTGLKANPDYVNYDLTAAKTFGKWTLGAVAFGSADTSCVGPCQSQFAIGGLIGYDFPGISVQMYGTKDVYSENYFNMDGSKSYETRLWTRVIIPLWNPAAESLK
ncbi:MAG: transporter [Rhodomicrobium sp.]